MSYYIYNIFVELPSAPAAGMPFAQHDWPNPARRRSTVTDFTDGTEFWMLVTQPRPFSQTSWPNPTLRRFSIQDFQNPAEVQFIGKDQFFAAPGMGPRYDYPNPMRRKFSMQDFTNNAEVHLLGQDKFFGPAGMAPTYDWPNPQRRVSRPPDQIGFVVGSEVWLFPSVQSPFRQLDWPNPQARRRVELGSIDSLKINLLVPFAQTDWPNPQRPRSIVQYFVNPAETQLFGQDTFFGPAGMGPRYDYPNPQRPRQRNEFGWSDTIKLAYVITPAPPFFQTSWPNPTLR